ncbi:hypothetical protein ACFZAS_42825, partial [Streptomyces lavendulae]
TLFWTGKPQGEAIGKGVRQWPSTGTVTISKDTSFMLRATTKNPSGTPEYHYQTIVINCTDPDLTANTLNVTNTTNLNGTTNLKTTNIATGNTLTANGPVTTNDDIHANGNVTISTAKTLHVRDIQGNGSYGSLDIGGRLVLSTAGRTVTVQSPLTVEGLITARAGIQGDGTTPLRVHQMAGLKVDAALDVGEYGGQATFRKQVNVSGGIAGAKVVVTPQAWTSNWVESKGGQKQAPNDQVMVGRGHSGDENGGTQHRYATIRVQ